MAFVITEPCIDTTDQSCVEVCPVDCIHSEPGVDRMLYIDPDACIDCGACVPACPVDAIYAENDVPPAQAPFIEINRLWFKDPDAARKRVGGAIKGGVTSPPAAAQAEPAAEHAASEPVATAVQAPGAQAAAASAPEEGTPERAMPAAPAERAEARPRASAAPSTHDAQELAVTPAARRGPSPVSVIAMTVFAAAFFAMWTMPGPVWLEIAGVRIGATVVLALPVALLAAFAFVRQEWATHRRFAARRGRRLGYWRLAKSTWRRSEESRRFELERVVAQVARERFPFPNAEHPQWRTYVNVPEPQMALDFGAGHVFPDIVVVERPGNRPVMVAQVETRETVTREQAHAVWAALECQEAPLYIYVPAGLGRLADDYALDAGINHYAIRTWQREPLGLLVHEI